VCVVSTMRASVFIQSQIRGVVVWVWVWGVCGGGGRGKREKQSWGRQTRPQHCDSRTTSSLHPILSTPRSLSPSRPETKVQIILKRACCGLHDTEDEKKTSKKTEIEKAENNGFALASVRCNRQFGVRECVSVWGGGEVGGVQKIPFHSRPP